MKNFRQKTRKSSHKFTIYEFTNVLNEMDIDLQTLIRLASQSKIKKHLPAQNRGEQARVPSVCSSRLLAGSGRRRLSPRLNNFPKVSEMIL